MGRKREVVARPSRSFLSFSLFLSFSFFFFLCRICMIKRERKTPGPWLSPSFSPVSSPSRQNLTLVRIAGYFFRRLFFLYLFYTTFPYGNDFPNFRSFPLSVCSKLDFLSRENRACLTGRCHFAARDAHSHHVWNLLLQILLFLPYVHYHFDVQRPVNSANRMFVSLATYYNL